MQQLNEALQTLLAAQPHRLILSKPRPAAQWRRVEVRRLETGWQLACYTDTQVFHENLDPDAFGPRLEQLAAGYGQLNGWSQGAQWSMLISKKGMATLKRQADAASADAAPAAHNRQKRYLLAEGQVIPPLVDMGVFTPDGRVVRAMYDKFRQINRFLELVEDEAGKLDTDTLHIIDFGCGKSYLTFVLYYYFTQVKKMRVEMVGLDLKADVIEKCNAAAKKYGYEGLRFELGDINGYKAPFAVDMVVTLHACDTATDYALFNAVEWGAKMIFSVPCCQHELNRQMDTQNLPIFGRYGIVQERLAALTTDAIRANLLQACGYSAQLLEFVDLSHTPKNLLIRAAKRPAMPAASRRRYLAEVTGVMEQFSLQPTLYRLLEQSGRLPK